MLGTSDILTLIVIGHAFGLFTFLYSKFWKVRRIPLSYKIRFGGLFIPLSVGYFCGTLFQLIEFFVLTFVYFLLIAGEIVLFMLSEVYGADAIRKLRWGRILLYLFGSGFGILGPIFLLLPLVTLMFNGSMKINWNGLTLISFGMILFIFSLWGFAHEEKYKLHDKKGEMRGFAFYYAYMVLAFLSFTTMISGVTVLGDFFFRTSPLHLNHLAGFLSFLIGTYLLIWSVRKMIYYKKFLEPLKMVKLVD